MFTTMLYGQEKVITGKVTSGEDGSPLPGASVVVKGTTTGTVTDIDGKLMFTIPENSLLVISYVGFLQEEVEVTTQTEINIVLVSILPGWMKLWWLDMACRKRAW